MRGFAMEMSCLSVFLCVCLTVRLFVNLSPVFFLTQLGGLLFRNEVWGSASGGGGGFVSSPIHLFI